MALIAVVSGAITGVIGAAFHLAVSRADTLRGDLLVWARQWPAMGWLAPVLLISVLAAVVQWTVQRLAPQAAGSGVPHIETNGTGDAPPPSLAVIPVTFVGGIVAIGSGLAVGREGSTGTIGATLGAYLARRARLSQERQHDVRVAVFGAGLGVAFNAPLGGLVYIFEGLTHRFTTEVMVPALAACAMAVLVMRGIMGNTAEFAVAPLAAPSLTTIAVCLVLGIVIGVLGSAYNRAILFWLDGNTAFNRLPGFARAAIVGAVVGLVAWFEPLLVGDGSQLLNDALGGRLTISFLLLASVARWVLGPLSYAAGTPGGLFGPSMVAGAAVGALFAGVANQLAPALALDPAMCAVAGMAAFIAAVVRAPFTGIALVIGVTGTVTPVIPMLAACFSAMLAPLLLNTAPIFTSLREHASRAEH